jgi:hypothetical protein
LTSIEEQKAIIEEDKLNQQTPFNPETQFYPADFFILKGFSHGYPIWERNDKWHDSRGYFIGGRPKK